MKFRRLAAADQEIKVAADWYDDLIPGLGDDFVAEVEAVLARVREHPMLYGRLQNFGGRDDVRHCPLERSPYFINYRTRPEEILVVAVSHARRKPFYWLERLS